MAGLIVFVGVGLETAEAAEVAVSLEDAGAVDELLLGEAEEFTRGDEVGTLE